MKSNTLARWACTTVVAGLGLAALPVTALARYDNLYVFGDSLSDNGNLFALTGNTFPLFPYYQGRLSDGPVAVELLATGLGATLHNRAIAGAHTSTVGNADPGLGGLTTGMTTQVNNFAAGLGGFNADSSALYFVWGGANDLRAAGAAAIAPTISNLTSIVSTLYGLGARDFLLPNLPNLGLTPEAIENGRSAGASMLSGFFNGNLATAYGGLANSLVDAHFTYFDAFAAQTAIVNGVGSNGFTDVTHRCFDDRVPSLCTTPGTFLYWDNIHPTAAAHALLGAQMLAAVPEPASMLMMAAGVLALVGLGLRRQH